MGFRKPTRSTEGKEYFALKDYRGELALFKVNDEDEKYVNPRFVKDGERPHVWADVTIVTGEGAGRFFPNADFGGKHVWEALQEAAGTGEYVLGRIIQGDQGGRPYFINDPEEGDEELAEAFLSSDQTAIPEQDSGDAAEEEVPY